MQRHPRAVARNRPLSSAGGFWCLGFIFFACVYATLTLLDTPDDFDDAPLTNERHISVLATPIARFGKDSDAPRVVQAWDGPRRVSDAEQADVVVI